MSGEHNTARELGFMDSHPIAVSFSFASDYSENSFPITLVSNSGTKLGEPIDEEQYNFYIKELRKALGKEWDSVYDNDQEYDLIYSYQVLGYNPVSLELEDPFAEGFTDEF